MLNRGGSLLLPLCCLTLAAAGCQMDQDNTTPVAKAKTGRYIVSFNDVAAGKAAAAALGGALARDLPSGHAAAYHLSDAAATALASNPHINFVEVDQIRVPLSTTNLSGGQVTPYGISMVQADQLSVGANGGDITVCIIDSGYSINHPDLSSDPSRISASPDSGSGDPYNDTCHHGTHVAGTIAALNNTEGVVGVVPNNVKLHIVKVFGNDTDPCAWSYSSDLVAAAETCRVAGANVVSMSLGCSGGPKNGPFACSSKTERAKFDQLEAEGILSIAAAGNDGNSDYSYPASYKSVMSVAAVDESENVASFSQYNNEVEIAAPGVSVLSTVPQGEGRDASLDVGTASYDAAGMEGSPLASGTGPLVDCGDGSSTCTGAAGAVCVIQRGTIAFSDKVLACQNGGGVAAIVYNNEPGMLYGTLGGVTTTIPSIGVAPDTGTALLASLGQSATVALTATDYAYFDGTSMATPHVSGVATLVWSQNTSWTASQIRDALDASAKDLGAAGRDSYFGYGLVQAKAAVDYLQNGPSCTPTETTETSCNDGIDNDCDGLVDSADSDCQPSTCTLAQVGDSCTSDADCCSNKCKGPRNGKSCK